MSMQINSQPATHLNFGGAKSATAADRHDKTQARRASFEQLSQAMSSGDLGSARTAYASLVKNAPAAASWRPDSSFAQLGKALIIGDMGAAQTAFDAMAVNRVKQSSATQPPPMVQPQDPIATSNGLLGAGLAIVA